jgi:ATP-dependent exoDNAse (exonuclease V) beta subunit
VGEAVARSAFVHAGQFCVLSFCLAGLRTSSAYFTARPPASRAGLCNKARTERHLLHAACTRARDHLLVTGVEPVSEFLEDLLGGPRHG